MSELTRERVAPLDWRNIITAAPDTPADIVAALDDYFRPFAEPCFRDDDKSKEMLCIECDKPLSGLTAMLFGGGFEWGIAHGEGHCAACRWPARAHHFIKDKDGKDIISVRNVVLQYHPEFVEKRRNATKPEADALLAALQEPHDG